MLRFRYYVKRVTDWIHYVISCLYLLAFEHAIKIPMFNLSLKELPGPSKLFISYSEEESLGDSTGRQFRGWKQPHLTFCSQGRRPHGPWTRLTMLLSTPLDISKPTLLSSTYREAAQKLKVKLLLGCERLDD
jgi:hypothetical protein